MHLALHRFHFMHTTRQFFIVSLFLLLLSIIASFFLLLSSETRNEFVLFFSCSFVSIIVFSYTVVGWIIFEVYNLFVPASVKEKLCSYIRTTYCFLWDKISASLSFILNTLKGTFFRSRSNFKGKIFRLRSNLLLVVGWLFVLIGSIGFIFYLLVLLNFFISFENIYHHHKFLLFLSMISTSLGVGGIGLRILLNNMTSKSFPKFALTSVFFLTFVLLFYLFFLSLMIHKDWSYLITNPEVLFLIISILGGGSFFIYFLSATPLFRYWEKNSVAFPA